MATPIALQNLLTLSSPQYSTRMTGGDYANTAAATALAQGANSYNIRKLNEQLAMAKKEYENLVTQQKTQNEQWEKAFTNTQSQQALSNKWNLINSGMLTDAERDALISGMLGEGGTPAGRFTVGARGMFGGFGGSRRPTGAGTDTGVTDLTGLLDEAIKADRMGELSNYQATGLTASGNPFMSTGLGTLPNPYTDIATDYRKKIKQLLGS